MSRGGGRWSDLGFEYGDPDRCCHERDWGPPKWRVGGDVARGPNV